MNLISDIEDFKLKYDNTNMFIEKNKLSDIVLDYYIENYKVVWYYISTYQTLSEQFIERYIDKVNLVSISHSQILSEHFIEQYNGKMSWYNISKFQVLSEAFIEKHKDKVDWDGISYYQTLSESFIDRYNDKVDWITIFRNKRITLRYKFIVEHLYKFNLYEVSIGISNTDNINRLVEEFKDKYEIDKLAYGCNKNN